MQWKRPKHQKSCLQLILAKKTATKVKKSK